MSHMLRAARQQQSELKYGVKAFTRVSAVGIFLGCFSATVRLDHSYRTKTSACRSFG